MDFGDAGKGADVLGVLLERGGNRGPAFLPIAVHEFNGLSEGLVALGEPVESLVDGHGRVALVSSLSHAHGFWVVLGRLWGVFSISYNGYYVNFCGSGSVCQSGSLDPDRGGVL